LLEDVYAGLGECLRLLKSILGLFLKELTSTAAIAPRKDGVCAIDYLESMSKKLGAPMFTLDFCHQLCYLSSNFSMVGVNQCRLGCFSGLGSAKRCQRSQSSCNTGNAGDQKSQGFGIRHTQFSFITPNV